MSNMAKIDNRPGNGRVTELRLPGVETLPPDPDVSVIVPVTERPEPLAELYLEFSAPLREAGYTYEFLFSVESRNQSAVTPLKELAKGGAPVRVLEVGHTVGESALLKLGASRARGRVLLSLPAYRRVVASALPDLIERVDGGADLASARRWPRKDSWVNRIQTRLLHSVISSVSAPDMQDVASGVRAMRPAVFADIPLYGDFFRFLPILAMREGFKVVEVDALQHPRDARTRVYSPGIYVRRLIDVLGLLFLSRFTYKPLRFFGLIGVTATGLGALMLFALLIQRLGGHGIANRPMLLLGVLIFTLGIQSIALGLIGEIIVHFNARTERPYRLAGIRPGDEVEEVGEVTVQEQAR